jgi:hypothetical protein
MKHRVEVWVNAYQSAVPGAIVLGISFQTRGEALEYRNEDGTPVGDPIKIVHEWEDAGEDKAKCDMEERLEDARQERLEVMREKGEGIK